MGDEALPRGSDQPVGASKDRQWRAGAVAAPTAVASSTLWWTSGLRPRGGQPGQQGKGEAALSTPSPSCRVSQRQHHTCTACVYLEDTCC